MSDTPLCDEMFADYGVIGDRPSARKVREMERECALWKRAAENKDFALIAAAGEREWLIGLIDKFPELDLNWPEETKALWWKHFEALALKAKAASAAKEMPR